MERCVIDSCKNTTSKRSSLLDNITFHRFPEEKTIKKKWIDAVGKDDTWVPCCSSAVCSEHFDDSCFQKYSSNRCLSCTAVPTLNLPVRIGTPGLIQEFEHPLYILKSAISDNLSPDLTPKMHHMIQEMTYLFSTLNHKKRELKRLRDSNRHLRRKVADLKEVLQSFAQSLIKKESDKNVR